MAAMHASHGEELRCPTCGARQGWTDTCRRCKSDLRFLRDAAEAYEGHRRASLLHLLDGEPEAALRHARICHELRPDAQSRRLLAICHLAHHDWADALAWAAAESGVQGR